jgi:TPR repeat protein
MGMTRLAAGPICACLLFGAPQSTFAQSGLMPGNSPFARCAHISDSGNDPRGGNFLPGKYFQIKAHKYLDNGDTTGALSMFEHAAYYGNKDAQYDMAMMYLRGASKVPVDVPRSVAWLKIASQYHQSDAARALQKIDSTLPGNSVISPTEFRKCSLPTMPWRQRNGAPDSSTNANGAMQ